MRLYFFYILSICCIGMLFQDCNDPALLGSDLLKQDEINLKFVDTFKIEARTIRDTGNIVYDISIPILPTSTPIGNFYDPIFGATDARIYGQFARFTSGDGISPSFKDAVLDSAMLYIAIDTITSPYGNTTELSNMEVYQMNAPIDVNKRYTTGSYSFGNLPSPIGQSNGLLINNKTRPRIPGPTDTTTFDPNIAFKLTPEFGNSILKLDSLVFNSDSIFRANVPGFMFKQADQNAVIYPFNISSSFSRLQILYTQNGIHLSHIFPLNASIARLPVYTHDYPMIIKDAINSETKGKEYIYLQSLAGLKAKINFTNLNLPVGSIINKAELEMTAITLPQDIPSTYAFPSQLALYKKDSSGYDILTADQGGDNTFDFNLLGGTPVIKEVNGTSVTVYTLNISNHVQRIVNGKEKPEVYIAIAPKTITQVIPVNTNLSRVVLGGPKHPVYPMKLKISFTTF